MTRRLLCAVLLLGLALGPADVALAKGPAATAIVTISGPGLEAPLVVSAPTLVDLFSLPMLADLSGGRVPAPARSGSTYLLTRYAVQASGVQPLGSVSYALPANPRQEPRIYYAFPAGGVTGQWFASSAPAAQVALCYLARHGARLDPRRQACPRWARQWLAGAGG